MEQISILIVDDHTLIRETWTFVLNNDPRFIVVGQASTGEEAEQMAAALHPDVIVMDITLPGIDGIDATAHILQKHPDIRIIGMSAHSQTEYAKRILENGALGYVTKNSSREEMYTAVIEVKNGRQYICKEIRETLSQEI